MFFALTKKLSISKKYGSRRCNLRAVKSLLYAPKVSRLENAMWSEPKAKKLSFARYINKLLNNFNVMDIKEIEKRIVDFAKKRASAKKFDLTPELSYIHLTEELGEVARQLSNKKIRPDLFDKDNLKEEIVDVILEATILANLCEVDLDKEIRQKIDALFKKHGFSE